MHALVELHGQPGWVAGLTPLSVDGMIVAASTTLLADSRSGSNGGALPWALLVIGSMASLAANVAVAEPTLVGRVIAAWPSFALTASYELLTRQVRHGAVGQGRRGQKIQTGRRNTMDVRGSAGKMQATKSAGTPQSVSGDKLQMQAWQWALARQASDGVLPSGKVIADAHGRHERWGRLVKNAGQAGALATSPRILKPHANGTDAL